MKPIQALYPREQSLHTLCDGGEFCENISHKIDGLFHIIPFTLLRHTDNVDFHSIPFLDHVNSMERVFHGAGAKSPGRVGDVAEGWYMHPSQEDNLITLDGYRVVELYTPQHGKIETFEISANYIKWNGKIVLDGPGILGWPTGVYHRNNSLIPSASLNLGIRYEGFDVDSEFNIYDVDVEKAEVHMIRKGSEDQPAAL